jgi:6-phosphogluconolactonase
LAQEDIPWAKIHIAQVDERVAPAEHFDRNLTHLRGSLLERAPLPSKQIYAMPVEAPDLETATRQYAVTLANLAGSPPVFDLIHLGPGPDGHTASLVPGDPVLEISDADVGVTGVYQERRRMTLTYPILNRARRILWLVTGREKIGMLGRLLKADTSIPAGRVSQAHAVVFADRAAAKNVQPGCKDHEGVEQLLGQG